MPAPDRRCVVLVEDDASMSQALERILRPRRLRAGNESSSAEALLEADPTNAVCLVLDVHLPGLTGFELHERL